MDINIINNGGWHFTNVKTPEDIEYKFKSYLHHNEFDKENLRVSDIKKLIPVNVLGFVNSSPDFIDQPRVLNGFTDKLDEFFSEKPTRSAVGVSSLPLNVCVEVQTVFYINE